MRRDSLLGLLALPLVTSLSLFGCASDSGDDDGVTGDDQEVIDPNAPRGRQTIHFASPTAGVQDEICVLPNHAPGGDYKKDDEEAEAELCSFSFYGAGPREAGVPKQDVAICPKLSSTNPGTDVHELLPGRSREQTEAEICSKEDRPSKLLAKYKQSITCSYTPSIIGYYHLSRLLGGVGDIKPVVMRTMDLAEHKKITGEALQILRNQSNSEYPKASWLTFQSAEANPAATRHKDNLYTNDLKQIYGGLQENARGEAKYSEINRRGGQGNEAGPFMRTEAWSRVANGAPLARIVGRSLADSAQAIVQMTDISEMLVMDYLMSQQDRFGNIHMVEYYYYPKPDAPGSIDKVKKSKVDDGEKPMPAGAVLVKKMLMKDNDCGGPTKTNVTKNAGMLDQIRHMDPATYSHLRWLAANFGQGTPIPKFFVSEALFVQRDVDMLRENLGAAAKKLRDNCVAGKLLLDLDLEGHLAGRGHDPALCEAAAPPKP